MKYKVHEVAAMFPLLTGRAYDDLVQNIQVHGQHEPIVVDGDVLLDGRNRLAICEASGIQPKIVQWRDLGLKVAQSEWIYSKNMERRHLTDDQRAAIGSDFITWSNREAARAEREKAQFKPGNEGGPGRGNKTVHPKSGEPLKRDAKAEHARSTAGRVAAATGTSRHKATMAIKLVEAAKNDPEAAVQLEEVKKGEQKLSSAVKIWDVGIKSINPARAEAAAAEAEADSDKLWQLKRSWKRAGKKDRESFMKWIEQQATA